MTRRTILALPLCAVVKSETPLQRAISDLDRASAEHLRRVDTMVDFGDELMALFWQAYESAREAQRAMESL